MYLLILQHWKQKPRQLLSKKKQKKLQQQKGMVHPIPSQQSIKGCYFRDVFFMLKKAWVHRLLSSQDLFPLLSGTFHHRGDVHAGDG